MTGRSGRRARARTGSLERLEGLHCVLEALRAERRKLHRVLVEAPRGRSKPSHEVQALLEAASARRVPVERLAPGDLPAGGDSRGSNQRIVLEAEPLPEVELPDLIASSDRARRIVVLDGVEDPQNLGAIARVAEASGVCGLVIGRRRSAPLSPAASRASAGALEWLPVARVPNVVRALEWLKERGFWVLGADQAGPRSLYEMPSRLLSGDLAVVLGAEGRGLRRSTREAVDHLVAIPMEGRISSLNVSTAGAVVLFELMRRRG